MNVLKEATNLDSLDGLELSKRKLYTEYDEETVEIKNLSKNMINQLIGGQKGEIMELEDMIEEKNEELRKIQKEIDYLEEAYQEKVEFLHRLQEVNKDKDWGD